MAPDVALYLGLGGAAAAVAILLWKAGIPPARS
jgi:shikimate 5-dehydrogenase